MEITMENNPERKQSVLQEVRAMLGVAREPLPIKEEIERTIARVSDEMDRVRQEAKENDRNA